jgi:ribonuclease P protein component
VLTANHRIRRGADFATTVRGGRRAARGALVVHLYLHDQAAADYLHDQAAADQLCDPAPTDGPEPARPEPRAGFVVSRAVGGATTRNLVKRRLRHLMRTRLDRLPPGSMLVVRALPAAATRSHQELGQDLDGALTRALTGKRR